MAGITEKLALKLKLKRINKEYRIIWKSVECCAYAIQKPTKDTRRNGRFAIS